MLCQMANQWAMYCCVCLSAGPALCVTVRGINALPAEKLSQLLAGSSSSVWGTPSRSTAGGSAAAGAGAAGSSGAAVLQMGLASAWAVTDVLQVGLL